MSSSKMGLDFSRLREKSVNPDPYDSSLYDPPYSLILQINYNDKTIIN
jgi:hypothetical protein